MKLVNISILKGFYNFWFMVIMGVYFGVIYYYGSCVMVLGVFEIAI